MNPYEELEERAFWSPAVAKRNMFDIHELWRPAFPVYAHSKVATFGSCFAQHIGRALRAKGFTWHITEKAPVGLSEASAAKFNYGVFTCRTGNIYTASLLSQWLSWASGDSPPDEVWHKEGRFFDPFRPVVEPGGFESPDELHVSRDVTIEALRAAVRSSDIFVFTLGLTESWQHRSNNYEYPMCPGTAAGDFSPEDHIFVNQDFPAIRRALTRSLRQLRRLNPRLRVILTVSPVPLTATMSGSHVLVATTESKSVLRAIAGSAAREFPFVDYFPSYEIISSTPFRGTFFEPNQRNVNRHGVQHVMDTFFTCLKSSYPEIDLDGTAKPSRNGRNGARTSRSEGNDMCEEELLGAFAPAK